MNYIDEIMKYKEALPKDTQHQCQVTIVKMINEGFTPEWVYTALNSRPKNNWIKWGFGLFFTERFRDEIDTELVVKDCDLYDLWNAKPGVNNE